MLKIFTSAIAAGALSALLVGGAIALPVAPATQLAVESNVTLVRDGCGRGMRYSHGRDRCVEQSDRGGRGRVRRDECGPGRHFSNRMERCVRNERSDRRHRGDDDGEAAGIAIGTILNAIGNSNSNNNRNKQHNNRNKKHNNRQQPGADGLDD